MHVSGAAIYVDDESSGRGTLEAWPVCSPHARARILGRDAAEAQQMPGITRVLFAEDVPGRNDVGPIRHDEPLLAADEVYYHGQIVALVVGETEECCRLTAERVRVEYEPLPAILTIRDAITANSFHTKPNFIRKPFHYFAVGSAVSEVEIDGRTGMTRLLRVDILHDAGDSINPEINRGQVEGDFIQGAGWLTTEALVWDKEGRLLTHSTDTYKIPAGGDIPLDFRVAFLSHATQANTIYGSKAVGEPPLMLAISVREAIRDAVAAFGEPGGLIPLSLPATSEAIFTALIERRRRSQATVFQEELSGASTASPKPAV
jgi:xanthine dehydrogenase molybdopterin-binding subunit B